MLLSPWVAETIRQSAPAATASKYGNVWLDAARPMDHDGIYKITHAAGLAHLAASGRGLFSQGSASHHLIESNNWPVKAAMSIRVYWHCRSRAGSAIVIMS